MAAPVFTSSVTELHHNQDLIGRTVFWDCQPGGCPTRNYWKIKPQTCTRVQPAMQQCSMEFIFRAFSHACSHTQVHTFTNKWTEIRCRVEGFFTDVRVTVFEVRSCLQITLVKRRLDGPIGSRMKLRAWNSLWVCLIMFDFHPSLISYSQISLITVVRFNFIQNIISFCCTWQHLKCAFYVLLPMFSILYIFI